MADESCNASSGFDVPYLYSLVAAGARHEFLRDGAVLAFFLVLLLLQLLAPLLHLLLGLLHPLQGCLLLLLLLAAAAVVFASVTYVHVVLFRLAVLEREPERCSEVVRILNRLR